jgi:hypothetical protein
VDDADLTAALLAERIAGDYYPHRPQEVAEDAVRLVRAARLLRDGAPDHVTGGASDGAAVARLLDAVGQARLRSACVDEAILDAALGVAAGILARRPAPGR